VNRCRGALAGPGGAGRCSDLFAEPAPVTLAFTRTYCLEAGATPDTWILRRVPARLTVPVNDTQSTVENVLKFHLKRSPETGTIVITRWEDGPPEPVSEAPVRDQIRSLGPPPGPEKGHAPSRTWRSWGIGPLGTPRKGTSISRFRAPMPIFDYRRR